MYSTTLRLIVDGRTGEQSLKRFEDRLGRTQRAGNRMSGTLSRMNNSLGRVSSLARPAAAGLGSIAATAGGLIYTTNQLANAAREVRNLSEVSRTGVEEFQRFAFGARELGVSQSQLSQIFLDTQDRIGDFLATGGGELQEYFENIAPQVGITADELARMSGPDALQALYSGLERANVSASEQRFYLEAIASDASQLIPLLKNGGEGFRDLAQEADNMNAVLSETEIENLSELSDEMGRVKQQFTVELSRTIGDNSEALLDLAESAGKLVATLADGAGSVVSFTQWVGEELRYSLRGAESDDMVRLTRQLREQQSELDELRQRRAELESEMESQGRGGMAIYQNRVEQLTQKIMDMSGEAWVTRNRIRDLRESQIEAAGSSEQSADSADRNADSIRGLADAAGEGALNVQTLAEAGEELKRVADERSADLLAQDLDEIRRIADPATEGLRELGDQLDALNRSSLPTQRADQLRMGLINEAEGGSALIRGFDAVEQATEDRVAELGGNAGEQFSEGFAGQTDRIGDSLADALMQGQWDGVGGSIGAVIGSSLSDKLSTSVGKSLTGYFEDAGSKFLEDAASSLGSIGGSIFGSVAGGLAGEATSRYVSDLLNTSSLAERGELAELRQEQQFTNTVLGGIEQQTRSITESTDEMVRALDDLVGANRAMLQSLQSSQRSQSRFTSSALRGLGGASFGAVDIGALGEIGDTFSNVTSDVISGLDTVTLGLSKVFGSGTLDDLLGDAFGSIFGGGTSLQDRGIEVIGGQIEDLIQGTVVNAYKTVEVDGGWFSSDSTERETRRIGGQIEQQFGNAISGITDSLVATAETLGMDAGRAASQLEDMQIRTRNISLMDMNAQERQEAIQSYFSSVFDRLSGRLFDWTRRFQEAGEGLGETVTRLATQNEVLRESHAQLGFVLNEGAMNAREFTSTADDFVATLGGVEAAASQISSFQSSFMTEAQQLESVEGQLNRAMEQVNLSLPDTRAGFLDLLQAQNAATEGGQRNIETILRVQDQADQYYSLLESRQSDATSSLESAMQSVQREIGQVESALDSMSQTAAQREMSRLDAVDTLRNALATGDFTGVGEAAQTAANLDASQFSTREQFMRAQGVTGNLLQQVQAEGEQQLSAAERQVNLAEQANTISESQLSTLERIERNLSATTVPGFASGGMHGGGARIVGERGPEIEFTGPSRIASNSESRSLLSMDQVVAELREVQNQLQRLNQYGYQTTKNTKKSSERLRRWDNIGQPPEREKL